MGDCFIILGAGHAGTAAAAAMRAAGFAGRVMLVSDDPHLPYERPPLSKDALRGEDAGAPLIFQESFYVDRAIELKLGVAAIAIDPVRQTVTMTDGQQLAFTKLLIATGARARAYPLLDALGENAHRLRNADDARGLRADLVPGRHLLIVGGGVIGLEVAATARSLGLSVEVIERAERLLARGTPEPLASLLAKAHAAHGVALHTGVELVSATQEAGKLTLSAADGRSFAGDLVVYGIGVTLNDEIAGTAGLVLEDGLVVDARGQTSHPAIFAAGDIARQYHSFIGSSARQETWANAVHQGGAVGRAMVSGESSDEEVPWYWTDQFGVNYQVAGRTQAEQWITRLGPDAQARLIFGLTDGVLVGAVGIDAGADMRFARKLIAQAARPEPAALADPAQAMRSIASARQPA